MDFVVFLNNEQEKDCPKIPIGLYEGFLNHVKERYDETEYWVDKEGNILVWESDVKRSRVCLEQFIEESKVKTCKCCGHKLEKVI